MSNVTVILHLDKQTENKVRYQAIFKEAKFNLYIPKWRIPNPWPKKTIVHIDETLEELDRHASQTALNGAAPIEGPINAIISNVVLHTQTVRFDPQGEKADWEIGATYIPSCLLPDPPPLRLLIQVNWDRAAVSRSLCAKLG